ncbi:hypothetical protein [Polyangium jinanense]|uniref:Uncharacterized protein n=1 Tax=Polyangium jinanense TaxID=2829994 RepID=A0A9X3XFH9_9BACT|nr:hypothetical protein [Polyangium jinanense]MDC3989327.1 hypothetical protein [Polyangium jinanense]
MVNGRTARGFWCGASGETRRRGALAAFGFLAAALLPACSAEVEIERSPAMHADGLYRGLFVGGSKPDGTFVLAQHELAPGDEELVLVSLAEGEKRTCSLGKAFFYHTAQPQPPPEFGVSEPFVDPRPTRILTLEGELGAESGDLRVFDASCVERMRVPSVEAPVQIIGGSTPRAYTAQTTSGEVVVIDPWADSVRTIAESASFWQYRQDKFWLIEGGRLVVRDLDGNILQTAGEGVTEVAVPYSGDEAAYVDATGLWVLESGDPGPIAIPTTAAPCKPQYGLGGAPLKLIYRDDCAAGVLAVLDRETGDTRLFSSGVTSAYAANHITMSWVFFEREEPGKKRELWAIQGAGEPMLVGTNPSPTWFAWPRKEDFLVELDHDGATATLGNWTPEGGFAPLLENFWDGWAGMKGYFPTLTDPEEDLGTLVVLDTTTLTEALRIPGVHRMTPDFVTQGRTLRYIHDWDDALGAGTFGAWVPATGKQLDVDTGVTESGELFWPEPGVVYAVRTPERVGIWTAYPKL